MLQVRVAVVGCTLAIFGDYMAAAPAVATTITITATVASSDLMCDLVASVPHLPRDWQFLLQQQNKLLAADCRGQIVFMLLRKLHTKNEEEWEEGEEVGVYIALWLE